MDVLLLVAGVFATLLILAAAALFSLHLLTPCPKRTKKEFLEPRFIYDPSGVSSERFPSLLRDDEAAGDWKGPQHSNSSIYLSVIVPAMNEEERLPYMMDECLAYLEERCTAEPRFTYEVIVVDDGSRDSTADTAHAYALKYSGDKVRVLKLAKNVGKGGAVRYGVLCARGSVILFADADGATTFSEFGKVEKELHRLTNSGNKLMAISDLDWTYPAISVGSRAHLEKQSMAERSLPRTVLMLGFHTLVYLFAVRSIHDTQCGFKLFTRGAASKLFPLLHIERWAFDVELLYLAEQHHIPIAECSVQWEEKDGSKIVPIWSWLQMGRDLVLIWFRYSTVAMAKGSRRKSGGVQHDEGADADSLRMEQERVLNTYDNGTDFPGSTPSFDVKAFGKNLKINIVNESEDGMTLEFDLVHVEAPIANALRRVLLAEVPTMALEKIYLYQNTSVIQDEVLCHRLGLLPVKADPRLFQWPDKRVIEVNAEGVDADEEPEGNPDQNLIFAVDVTCTVNKSANPTATEPKDRFNDSHVYSKAFTWAPIGDQAEKFAGEEPKLVNDDILVAKLRPGQQIEARCHCVKGIGRDHAKFSPVATATYRLLPKIKIKEKITGEAAERFAASFSEGVVGLVEEKGETVAKVVDARRDTCSRNVLRHEDLAEKVELSRKKDHFIFSVESTGALKSSELVVEACKVMEAKALSLKELIEQQLNVIEKAD